MVGVLGTPMKAGGKIKYLGVTLDKRLKWGERVMMAANKANKSVKVLHKLMPNTDGPITSKRRMLNAMGNSTLLYAVPAWIDALKIKKYNGRLIKPREKP